MTQLFLQDILGRLLFTASLIGTIEAYATGAPNSEEVCQYMFPGHEVDAQSTKPPFVIELKKKTFSEGGDKIEGTSLFTLYANATFEVSYTEMLLTRVRCLFRLSQGGTSDVVLYVACFGVSFCTVSPMCLECI